MDPDKLMLGIKHYVDTKSMHLLFDFLGRYVRKLQLVELITKLIQRNAGSLFLDIVGPSDIVYVIALVKNARDMWDQEEKFSASVGEELVVEPEKKLCPFFALSSTW